MSQTEEAIMEVKQYKDLDGNWFREIIEKSYTPLRDLRDAYKKQGKQTWINPYDTSWMLTILMGKEK